MPQTLPIALAQGKTGNTSGFNKVFNKVIIQKMNIIFMNPKNSKTSDPQRLLLNLIDKIDLSRKDKYISVSNLGICYT